MSKTTGNEWSFRLLTATVAGAALMGGVVAAAGPASAAASGQSHRAPRHWRLGARKTPFSPRTATSATAKGVMPADAADHPWLVGIIPPVPTARWRRASARSSAAPRS